MENICFDESSNFFYRQIKNSVRTDEPVCWELTTLTAPNISRMRQAVNENTKFLNQLPRIRTHTHFMSFLCTTNYQFNSIS